VQAVKLYSEVTGAGLGEAKSAVDRIETSYLAGG
jgi:ribosomal protein L7/L12